MVSNHSKVGYEPTLIPDHTGVEESSGNDPQSVSHRSHCLANKSRRLQGLLSIVFTTGYDPITSDVSDRRSTNWATWTIRYFSRDEPNCHFLLDILWSTYYSSYRYHWGPQHCILADQAGLEPTIPWLTVKCFTIKLLIQLVGEEGLEPPRLSRQIYSLLSQPIAQLSLLYTLQGSNLWPVVCKTTATTIWAKSACFSFLEQI